MVEIRAVQCDIGDARAPESMWACAKNEITAAAAVRYSFASVWDSLTRR